MSRNKSNNQNGKGDSPRNNSSNQFRDNYSKINWKQTKKSFTKQRKNSIIAE